MTDILFVGMFAGAIGTIVCAVNLFFGLVEEILKNVK